jgi:hypothetical protein
VAFREKNAIVEIGRKAVHEEQGRVSTFISIEFSRRIFIFSQQSSEHHLLCIAHPLEV